MSRPKMIGAHVPQKPKPKSRYAFAKDFNQAFDRVFAAKPGRSHLVYTPAPFHATAIELKTEKP